MIEYFNNFVRPVVFTTTVEEYCNQIPYISGTCFLLKILNKFVAVTAGHIFRNSNIQDLRILFKPFATEETESHELLAISGGFNFYNGSPEDPNYDADAYDFCIINVAQEEASQDLMSVFFEYIAPDADDFNLGSNVIVAGYPKVFQEIDYDSMTGDFDMVAISGSIVRLSQNCLHFELATPPNAEGDFNGFSGAPVFYQSTDGRWKILGLVIRGTASSGIMHCINIRMIEVALIQRERNIAEGIRPEHIGVTYNDGGSQDSTRII